MGEFKECELCEIKFYDIGDLKAEVRVQRHTRVSHTVPCNICEKTFVSITHNTFHQHFSHNIVCPHCEAFCEGYCSSLYSVGTEKAGGKIMEMTEQGIMDRTRDVESRVEKLIGSVTGDKIEALQYCANRIDA